MSPELLQSGLLTSFAELVEKRYGLRLSDRQVQQLGHLVVDVLPTTAVHSPAQLLTAFTGGAYPETLQALAARLTIGETHFFRVAPQIEALRAAVLPNVLRHRAADRRVRAWSAGCSTGEEPYTLAILVRELLGPAAGWSVEILGTDINQLALAVARLGLYREWSFRETPGLIRRQYFRPVGNDWLLVDAVRSLVRFEYVNLIQDAFPAGAADGGFDVILCRNVTIYFGPAASQDLYRRLAHALAPNGWLVLGPSDLAPTSVTGLVPVYLEGAVLWRRAAGVPTPASVPPPAYGPNPVARKSLVAAAAPRTAEPRSDEAREYLRAGMVRLDEGDADGAIKSLRQATFLDQDNPLAQFSLGCAYRHSGNRSRARAAFVHARRLLAGVGDEQVVADSGVVAGQIREAIDAQLANQCGSTP